MKCLLCNKYIEDVSKGTTQTMINQGEKSPGEKSLWMPFNQ